MEAVHRFDVATDTSQFTPDQLHAATVVSLGFQGWARWLREFLVPFPTLVHAEHVGVVVVTLIIRYVEPFRFQDGEVLSVSTSVSDSGGGRLLSLQTAIESEQRVVAEAETLLRVIALESDASLAGAPGRLPDRIAEKASTVMGRGGRIKRPARDLVNELRDVEPLLVGRHDFVVHRHLCEVADQWSIVHVPSIAAAAREQLLLAGTDGPAGSALGRPLSRVDIELSRPLFLFDEASVETAVHRDATVFVHRIISGPERSLHATVVETLAST